MRSQSQFRQREQPPVDGEDERKESFSKDHVQKSESRRTEPSALGSERDGWRSLVVGQEAGKGLGLPFQRQGSSPRAALRGGRGGPHSRRVGAWAGGRRSLSSHLLLLFAASSALHICSCALQAPCSLSAARTTSPSGPCVVTPTQTAVFISRPRLRRPHGWLYLGRCSVSGASADTLAPRHSSLFTSGFFLFVFCFPKNDHLLGVGTVSHACCCYAWPKWPAVMGSVDG